MESNEKVSLILSYVVFLEMSEQIHNRTVFSLLEVTTSIQETLAARYKSAFWVKAEMNKLNHYPQSGHCYPELVEKRGGKIIAQIRATLWSEDYRRINAIFLRTLHEPLKNGITILFHAKIAFDPSHGLTLRILDIDPAYSLGELEREKHDTIARLQQEGIYQRNKSLALPLLPSRIAIISVETSKGYADFRKVIDGNPWGYAFPYMLFPAVLQGDRAAETIRYQLERIRKVAHHFDIVAIIRGGGGDIGLTCYNNYELARAIALFPLPVLTGIGHATNETVAEMISFKNAITPTELADYLLQRFHNVAVPVQRAEERIHARATQMLADHHAALRSQVKYFRSLTDTVLSLNRNTIDNARVDLYRQARVLLAQEKALLLRATTGLEKDSSIRLNRANDSLMQLMQGLRLAKHLIGHKANDVEHAARTVSILDPKNVLKRGYSITLHEGKALTSPKDLKAGNEVKTLFYEGTMLARVVEIKQQDDAG